MILRVLISKGPKNQGDALLMRPVVPTRLNSTLRVPLVSPVDIVGFFGFDGQSLQFAFIFLFVAECLSD